MIFFDIPENRRRDRLWLYNELIGSGYRPIQKSVFIGKYPLDQKLMEIIIDKKLYSCVRIMTIGEIDNDELLFV